MSRHRWSDLLHRAAHRLPGPRPQRPPGRARGASSSRAPLTLSALLVLLLGMLIPLTASPAGAAPQDRAPAAPRPSAARTAAEVPLENITATTTQVASGLRRPTAIAAPSDGTGRLFITEKPGTVRVYHPATGLAAAPLLDITSSIDESGNERGLLGMALPADFATSHDLYLAYTALPDGAVTLGRYDLDTRTLTPLLAQEHAEYNNHNGGQLAFGPDGYLYWSIGDGGGAGDPFDTGQRLDTLLGKILRIDVSRACGSLAYCVPSDNPFVRTAGARPEIWTYGLRNAWRFSFDPKDGSLWIGDVGQGRWEEIDHLRAGRQAGANLGWSCYEGLDVFDAAQCTSGATYTKPVHTYSPYTGGCAVIGGQVYRGKQYAGLVGGTYIATDYCSSTVMALREDGAGGYRQAELGEFPTQVTAVGTTAEGEFYVVNDLPGGLHRVAFTQTGAPCKVQYARTAWGTGLTVDVTVTNTGTTPIDGWAARFLLPAGQSVVSDWNTELFQGENLVTARNAEQNRVIAPGASVTFGYLANHTGDSSPPRAFSLNRHTCAVG